MTRPPIGEGILRRCIFYTTAPVSTHGRNKRLAGCVSRSGIRASDNRVETPSRTPQGVANHESAYVQRKPTYRYSDVRTSTFRGRAKAAAEAKNPARNRRAIGRTLAAWNWNDGTHEKVDPGGITGLGVEARYPRKLISAHPGTVPGPPLCVEIWRFATVVRK